MVRSLLRAPLRFRRITLPPAPVLYCRPVNPVNTTSTSTTNQRSFTPSRRFNQTSSDARAHSGDEKPTTEPNSEPVSLSYIRLRDRCKCPLCVDVHSKQRNFRSSDIPPNIQAKSLKWDGDILEVSWESDIPGFDSSHISRYTLDEVRSPTHYPVSCDTGSKRNRISWSRKRMESLQHWISYEDYIHNDAEFTRAMRQLAVLGMIFVKDIPDSREMVEKVVKRIGPLRNTFYGQTWDVRTVPQAKNVAYTSQFLGFHMDLMYMREPPAFQFLHCLRNSCDGGESLFADAFHVAETMYKDERHNFDTLTQTNLKYEYLHEDSIYSRSRPVFETGTPTTAGSLLRAVNYSPPFQGPQVDMEGTENASIERQKLELEALKSFANRLESEEEMFELKLKPGECVIFENRRIVHARRQFNTAFGERWLAGAYLDEDVVLSRFRVQQNKNPEAWLKFGDKGVSALLEDVKTSQCS
ncbi:hypothetical protein BJX76DRAFT_321860 [Aspergillus varians]